MNPSLLSCWIPLAHCKSPPWNFLALWAKAPETGTVIFSHPHVPWSQKPKAQRHLSQSSLDDHTALNKQDNKPQGTILWLSFCGVVLPVDIEGLTLRVANLPLTRPYWGHTVHVVTAFSSVCPGYLMARSLEAAHSTMWSSCVGGDQIMCLQWEFLDVTEMLQLITQGSPIVPSLIAFLKDITQTSVWPGN